MKHFMFRCAVLLVVQFFPTPVCGHDSPVHIPVKLRAHSGTLPLENAVVDAFGLQRFADCHGIASAVRAGLLVKAVGGDGWLVDPDFSDGYVCEELPNALWHARPWVEDFLEQESWYMRLFLPEEYLLASGLTRDDRRQRQLLRSGNVNAARGRSSGTKTTHDSGSTVDLSKRFMTRAGIEHLRRRLIHLQDCGWVVAHEEFYTNSFHILVLPTYGKQWDCDGSLWLPREARFRGAPTTRVTAR